MKDLATPHKKKQATQKKCTCDDKGFGRNARNS